MNVAFEFVLFSLACACEASAILPSPQNVTVQTLNTQYILRWQWDQQPPANQTVNFTAQYQHKFKLRKRKREWTSVCSETLDTQCDFTGCNLHYKGIYLLQVRASSAGESSEWVEKEFYPDQDAALGPPSKVEVTPGDGLLRLSISDPLTSDNASMTLLLPKMYYLVQYWKQARGALEEIKVLKTSNNDVTLPTLRAWTTYCVRVRSQNDFYNKSSHFSPVQCLDTAGHIPAWLVILIMALVVALLSYPIFRCLLVIKSTFFPSSQLPLSIYLCNSIASSDWPHLLAPGSQVEEFCEKLNVCPKVAPPKTPALYNCPAPNLDTSSQSYHGSQDSGVYSTEEGSAPLGVASGCGLVAAGRCPGAGEGGDRERQQHPPPDFSDAHDRVDNGVPEPKTKDEHRGRACFQKT
ncbi:hypothetical protein AAFF_G00167460 [Aldrovandia affinis]|uniref:Fibronectin type-III domain-containing protein n=1 Tax=Aldrovandia affinis TaxID=143900 RepID=A0AAD7RMQ9_9TELE|nr:hypothetical protein AAFF_G00167460 [Aldrovandia affinis]